MARSKKSVEINYAEIIERKFKEDEFIFTLNRYETATIFTIPMPAKNAPGLHIKLKISQMDGRFFTYISDEIPKKKRIKILEVLNNLLDRYRYISLCLEDDGSICASYDFSFYTEDEDLIMRQVVTTLYLVKDIIDNCIPPIMMTLWQKDDDDDEEEETEEFEEDEEDEEDEPEEDEDDMTDKK
ncbi:MAG: hypothetical protein IJ728_10410 [Selenomonadaceae bacterium]|nr:hypothetical protein [Selenomonadaceae bacterium]